MATFDQRLEQEKLAALKGLAYGAGHEVNNPLANIAARAQTLLTDETHPERRRKLIAIHRQAMRAHEMIADLMLFAQPPHMVVADFNLRATVASAVEELRDLAAEREIQMECDSDNSALVIAGDETQLAVAIGAVIKNAIEAVGANGHVRISLQCATIDGDVRAEVVVRDDGPGISEEVRRHIFDPFFSGREAGRGLGFGLSKCWRIVTEHRGRVAVNSDGRLGAEFTISLPLRAAA